jgi:hypothetical protein
MLEEEVQVDFLRVFYRKTKEQDEQDNADGGGDYFHCRFLFFKTGKPGSDPRV